MLMPIDNAEELTYFASEVKRLSKEKLRIRLVRSGYSKRLDYEARTIRDVQNGRTDLGFAGTRAWDEFGVRRMSALMAPLLVDSYPLEERVVGGDIGRQMLAELGPLGLVGIGILPGGIRHPFGVSQRLGGPADYRGLTIGTQQSRVAEDTLRALGASPVRIPADTLRFKGVDGFEQRAYVLYGDRLTVPGSHVTANVNLWPRPLVIFAHAGAFKRLSAGERDVLRQAAANAVPKATEMARASDMEMVGNLCRTAQTTVDRATPAELNALRQAVAPVYRTLESTKDIAAALREIENLKAQLAAPPSSLPTCSGQPAASGKAKTKLDGVWQMDTDTSAAAPEGLDENWGHWIFVFDRGNFGATQENKTSCTWGYGTFAVRGDKTFWKFTDGGGIAPNDATNKPGEYFVFRVSSYRDTLTLNPVHDAIGPLNFRAKPWRRLSSTPSRRFFSKRCPPPAQALPG